MESVRALGYVPNRIAGSLASLDSRLVGVVIPSLSNIVFPEILQGINAGLAGTDRQSVISVTDYDLDQEEVVVRNLLAWQPAAVLIAGSTHTDATRRMLDQSGIRDRRVHGDRPSADRRRRRSVACGGGSRLGSAPGRARLSAVRLCRLWRHGRYPGADAV